MSPGGSFLEDILGPSVLAGIGAAMAFIAGTIAATTGAAEEDAGLASGLLNTSQQVGGAIGIAAIAAIATAQTNDALGLGEALPVALTEGYQTGYLVVAGVALAAAVVVAILVPGRRVQPAVEGVVEPRAAADRRLTRVRPGPGPAGPGPRVRPRARRVRVAGASCGGIDMPATIVPR